MDFNIRFQVFELNSNYMRFYILKNSQKSFLVNLYYLMHFILLFS